MITLKRGKPYGVFLYETGDMLMGAEVEVYEGGVVHVTTQWEEFTTNLNNCMIVWREESPEAPVQGEGNQVIPMKKRRKLDG